MNRVQVIIFLLVLLGPAVAQIYQKAKEKQKIDRANKQHKAMQHEALRTGRPVAEISEEAAAPAEESRADKMASLERERQTRLAVLRDQARQRALSKQAQMLQRATASQARTTRTPVPALDARQAAEQARQQRQSQQRHAQQQQKQQQRRVRRPKQAVAVPKQVRAVLRESQTGLTESQQRHRKEEALQLQRDKVAKDLFHKERASSANIVEWLKNPAALRRAIVMHEVLGPPVSLRS